MKTRYGTLLSTLLAASLVACGGSQAPGSGQHLQKVYVETSNALTIANVASVTISGTGATVGAFGPLALTYTATTGKFSGNFSLAPDTYSLTVTVTSNTTPAIVSTQTLNNIVVNGTTVTNISFNVTEPGEAVPNAGFVITGFAGPGVVAAGATLQGPFSIGIVTGPGAATPTIAWTVAPAGCVTFDTATAASTTFSSGATAQVCTVTATVTDGSDTTVKASRTATLGVGVDAAVTGTFVPSPTATQVVLFGNGGWKLDGTQAAEPTCTIKRNPLQDPAKGNRTCPAVYKILSGPPVDPTANPLVLTATQFEVGVTYDLGGQFDPSKPPTVGVDVSCPNATTNGVSLYTAAKPILGSGPGTAACPAASIPCLGQAVGYWTEPIAFVSPATSDLCTVTVTVKNQGAIDTFPIFVAISQ